jgi:translation initiation factor IF-1
MDVLCESSSKVVQCVKRIGSFACPRRLFQVRLRRTMPDATIHTVGKVIENLNPVLYQVSMPNGKIIMAHLSKELMEAEASFCPADCVLLELTAYDFDQARILRRMPEES